VVDTASGIVVTRFMALWFDFYLINKITCYYACYAKVMRHGVVKTSRAR